MKNRLFKFLLVISLSANILFATGFGYVIVKKGGLSYIKSKFVQPASPSNAQNSGKPSNSSSARPYYRAKVQLFRQLGNDTGDIYFVGDSITDRAEWQEIFETSNVKNRGIAGDTTDGIIHRLDEITEGRPDKIFLMCGINDILRRLPPDQIVDNVRAVLDTIHTKSPATKVYVQSVLPVNEILYRQWMLPKFGANAHIPQKSEVRQLNAQLQMLCRRFPYAEYVALNHLVGDDGELKPDYTFDGLHLNGKGLMAWADMIAPRVKP